MDRLSSLSEELRTRWGYRICVGREIYDPSDDTYLVLKYLQENPGLVASKIIWDVGCGSGIIGLHAMILGAREVFMTDINPQAAMSSACTTGINGFDEVPDIVVCDLDSCMREGVRFDTIIFNMPYLPVECGEDWLSFAWCTREGRVDKLIERLVDRVNERGVLLYTMSSKMGLNSVFGGISARKKLFQRIVSKADFFFEKVFLVEARMS